MNWGLHFERKAQQDMEWWKKKDKQQFENCCKLIKEIAENPREGCGRPERLRYVSKQERWSRRVSKKDRIIYNIDEKTKTVYIIACRGHYG